MKNYVQRGDTLTLTAPEAITSGGVVIVGGFIGIAAHDADNGADVETNLAGVYTLPKAAVAVSQGDTLYWSTANGNVNKTASGNTLIGHATAAAGSGVTTATVRLAG